jgi:HAD superfamily hydrolase (TIGR01484 family)
MNPRALQFWQPHSPIVGVLTDVDDTLTTNGKLLPTTLAAMGRLQAHGIALIPVTGRSTGWAQMMLAQWPVDAVIAEGGAVCICAANPPLDQLRPTPGYHQLLHSSIEPKQRAGLLAVLDEVTRQYPQLTYSSDQAFRLVDCALNVAEFGADVNDELIEAALKAIHAAGYAAQASSIHINAWIGRFNKGLGAKEFLEKLYADPSKHDPVAWVAIGDAPNDAGLFEVFPNSVLVANGLPHIAAFKKPPAYKTQAPYGAGFIELADYLIRAAA